MKRILIIGAVIALIYSLTSCATLFYGDRGSATINSNPPNQTVDRLVLKRGKTQLEVNNVTFPYQLPNKFGKHHKDVYVTAYKDGKETTVIVDKKFNSPGLLVLDFFMGGFISTGFDWAMGCTSRPRKDSYTLNFQEMKLAEAPVETTSNLTAEKNSTESKKISQFFSFLDKKGSESNQSNQLSQKSEKSEKPLSKKSTLSDVDKNIPVTGKNAENTFVLIIANENYAFVDDVEFALNDGRIFKEYCVKTLGVPEKQVWLYENASYGILNAGVSKMVQAMELFDKPNAIIYYCGHGIPDEKTNDAYIIPTDGNGKNTATCYSLNALYKTFAKTKAAQITYFMDACFTGASKDGSMLVAARGVAREPKKEVLTGKSVVFSATSADETAMSYKEKQHGLFTYYLLKKLQETKGDVNYDELSQYINKNVKKEAFLTNEKPQTPVVATSPALKNTWKTIKLK